MTTSAVVKERRGEGWKAVEEEGERKGEEEGRRRRGVGGQEEGPKGAWNLEKEHRWDGGEVLVVQEEAVEGKWNLKEEHRWGGGEVLVVQEAAEGEWNLKGGFGLGGGREEAEEAKAACGGGRSRARGVSISTRSLVRTFRRGRTAEEVNTYLHGTCSKCAAMRGPKHEQLQPKPRRGAEAVRARAHTHTHTHTRMHDSDIYDRI